MKLLPAFTLLIGLALFRLPAGGETRLPAMFDPNRHMLVSEVREGMTGYGLSVFKGTKIERFDVKVLAVLHDFNPKYDVVLIDCHGQNLEHTGSIAGMSGSPVFLRDEQGRDRMIGAFAYGWPLMKDPVAGVQPIEYMLALPNEKRSLAPLAPAEGPKLSRTPVESPGDAARQPVGRVHWSLNDVPGLLGPKNATLRNSLNAAALSPEGRLSLGSEAPRLQPLATPMMTIGMSPRLLEQFAPAFAARGLVALQAGGLSAGNAGSPAAATQPIIMAPGGVLAVPLLTGDAEMTAVGTCTEVLGDRIYGFGHSFNNEGPISMPVGTGQISAIIANLNTSFKLGSLSRVTGTLLADQTVGVAGRTGASPAMVPMDVKLVYADGSGQESYHFNLAAHPKFTSIIAAAAVGATLSGARELPQYHTIDYDLNMDFANGRSIHLVNSDVNVSAADLFNEIGIPIAAAADNPFERIGLSRISGTVTVTPEAREARIQSVTVPRLKYQPGDIAKIFVTYRPFRAGEAILPVEFELPRDLRDGAYQLVVTDWQTYLQSEVAARPFRFTAENINEIFAVLNDAMSIRHNAIYVELVRQADGVAIGRTAMPHLPASRRQVLMDAGLSNTTQFVTSTLKVVPTTLVMNGSAAFTITINREVKVESAAHPAGKHDVHPPAVVPKADEPKLKPVNKPEPAPPAKPNGEQGNTVGGRQ